MGTKARSPSTAPMVRSPAFDIVVKGGRLIDPANGIDAVRDIGVRKGKVAAVAPKLAPGKAKVIDATGLIVTPGLIDTHAHVYEHVSGDFGALTRISWVFAPASRPSSIKAGLAP